MIKVSSELPANDRLFELLLVAAVLCVSALMWVYYVETPWLLHLYYVPVVLTGFYLGKFRARILALLCVLTATIIFLPALNNSDSDGIPLATALAFTLWVVTLVSTAVLVGSLSDRWRLAMNELREAHKKDVLIDPLTQIANRRAFEFELGRRLAEWNRSRSPVALVTFDIDYFKSFNDRYGHQAGDTVLREVAKALDATVRDSDLPARCGGEEFAIVLPGVDVRRAQEIAERARSLIEGTRFQHNGLTLRLTVSVGLACAQSAETAEALVNRADAALYHSKEAGRNCSHWHDGRACERFGNGVAKEAAHTTDEGETTRNEQSGDFYTDPTTGMPSLKVFLEELRRRTAETQRYGGNLCVAIVGINDYLTANDKRSKKSLLATVARLTSSVLREPDLVVRYDNNLLGVLMPATPLERSLIPLGRLHRKAEEHTEVQYPSLTYGVTIGVVQLTNEDTAGTVLQRAGEAHRFAGNSSSAGVGVHDGTECHLAEGQGAGVAD